MVRHKIGNILFALFLVATGLSIAAVVGAWWCGFQGIAFGWKTSPDIDSYRLLAFGDESIRYAARTSPSILPSDEPEFAEFIRDLRPYTLTRSKSASSPGPISFSWFFGVVDEGGYRNVFIPLHGPSLVALALTFLFARWNQARKRMRQLRKSGVSATSSSGMGNEFVLRADSDVLARAKVTIVRKATSLATNLLWIISIALVGLAWTYNFKGTGFGWKTEANPLSHRVVSFGNGEMRYTCFSDESSLPIADSAFMQDVKDRPAHAVYRFERVVRPKKAASSLKPFSISNQGAFKHVRISLYYPTLIVAVFSFFFVRRKWRHTLTNRRRDNSLCLRCGYDLRGSTERCPECGQSIA